MAWTSHGYNWDAWSHKDLHRMIHGEPAVVAFDPTGGRPGVGPSSASDAEARWERFAAMMADARDRTEAALAKAGVDWEGAAADSLRAGISPLSQWAVDAHEAGAASRGSVSGFGSSYSAARDRMPEPVEVTASDSGFFGIPAGFTHLLGGQTDQDRQEAQAQAAKQEAVRVMNGYNTESSRSSSSVGTFVPPPPVVVEIAEPSPKTGDDKPPRVRDVDQPRDDWRQQYRPPALDIPPPSEPRDKPGQDVATQDTDRRGTETSSVDSPAKTTPTPRVPPSVVPSPPGGTGGWLPGIVGPGQPGANRGTSSPGRGPANTRLPGPGTGKPGPGGTGRGIDGPGGRAPVGEPGAGRGAGVGRGPLPGGVGAAGAAATAGQAGRGMGAGVGGGLGGGRGSDEEDLEHFTPDYLKDTHDEFWDDRPPVVPPVIGE